MTDVLSVITEGCTQLTASSTASEDLVTIGKSITLSIGTCLFVWEGIMQALRKSIDAVKLAQIVFMFMIVYSFVNFYNSSLPGMSYSLKTLVSQGTLAIVKDIGVSNQQTLLDNLTAGLRAMHAPFILVAASVPGIVMAYFVILIMISLIQASAVCVIAYGVVAASVMALLGPLFIPWLLIGKLEWLFWGWFRAYLGFSFYQVVAAAVTFVLSQLFSQLFTPNYISGIVANPLTAITAIPLLAILCVTCVYILFKIPALTGSLFSGHVSGHQDVGQALVSGVMSVAKIAMLAG